MAVRLVSVDTEGGYTLPDPVAATLPTVASVTAAQETAESAASAATAIVDTTPVNVAQYGFTKTAVIAALDAAQLRGPGTICYFPAGEYELEEGLSLSGYSVQIRGDGAVGPLATPTGTVFKASAQDGPVLDFTGWVKPGSFMGRATHGGFHIVGSGESDATKNNAGVRLTSMSSANFFDIAVRDTGGPCWEHASNPGNGVYLCDFERIILTPPVDAKTNDVPWMVMDESNGNRFRAFGLRSLLSSGDVGEGGAIILHGNASFSPHDNLLDGWWVEFLHPPTDGTIFHFEANSTIVSDIQFFDCSKESGATGTSHFRLAPPTVSDFGGNLIRGVIPGKGTEGTAIDCGVDMRQSRNSVRGVKGYRGTNVIIASGVTNTDVDLGGANAGASDAAVVDNSGSNTQRYSDGHLRSETVGPWLRDTGTASGNGPRFQDRGSSGNGSVHLGTAGVRLNSSANSLIVSANGIVLRNLALNAAAQITLGPNGTWPSVTVGSGDPAGAVAAPVGSLFLRTDGGAGTSLYVKESGTGTSGWAAK